MSVANAVLAVGVSIAGYEMLVCEGQVAKDVLKIAIGIISAGQIGLLVLYSGLRHRWTEIIKQESDLNVTSIKKPKKCGLWTLLQCFLHAIVPLPGLTYHWSLFVLGRDYEMSLDSVLYVVLLLRNYSALVGAFWLSELSTRRFSILAKVGNVRMWLGFCLRYSLYRYNWLVLVGIYLFAMLLGGVIGSVLDQSTGLGNSI